MLESANTKYLGEDKITSLMWKFSIPCVLSLIVGGFYNVIDQIFIGNSELSTLGNAATGVVFPLFIVGQAFAWCFGDGCAAYLSIHQGKNDLKTVAKTMGTALSLTLISSLLLMVIFYSIKEPVLMLFGASENNLPLAIEYFNIILAFFPMFILSNTMMSIIRADGSPSYAMKVMLWGVAVNLILDPILIFGFKWGMTGAAIATVVGQTISFILAFIYLRNPKTFKFTKECFRPHFKCFKSIMRLGISTFITQNTLLIITVLCNISLVKYGMNSHFGPDIPIAIIGIATKVFSIVTLLVVGVVLGCQPIISYNMGAGKIDRVKEVYKRIMFLTVLIGIIATLIFQFFPNVVVGMFGKPTNVPNPDDYWLFAEKTFRIYLMFLVFTCIIKMNAIFFQAVGKSLLSVGASVVRDVFCFIPLVLILPRFYGIEGVLYAGPIADLLGMIFTAFLICRFIRELNSMEKAVKL